MKTLLTTCVLALAVSAHAQTVCDTAASALPLYEQAIALGRGEEDFSVVVEPLRKA